MAIVAVACEFRVKPNEEDDAQVHIQVQRYDRLESRYLTTGDFSALQQMNTDYPVETRTLVEDMLQLGEVNDHEINARFLNFFQDSLLQMIIADAEAQYADISDIDKQLQQSFGRLQRLIPDIPLPEVYAQIGALGQSIVVGDGLIGISLDKYLGSDYAPYGNFYDARQRSTMTRAAIVPDCLVFWLLSHYPMQDFEASQQQQRDVHMGRVMWVVNRALGTPFFKTPFTAQAEKFMQKHPGTSAADLLRKEL